MPIPVKRMIYQYLVDDLPDTHYNASKTEGYGNPRLISLPHNQDVKLHDMEYIWSHTSPGVRDYLEVYLDQHTYHFVSLADFSRWCRFLRKVFPGKVALQFNNLYEYLVLVGAKLTPGVDLSRFFYNGKGLMKMHIKKLEIMIPLPHITNVLTEIGRNCELRHFLRFGCHYAAVGWFLKRLRKYTTEMGSVEVAGALTQMQMLQFDVDEDDRQTYLRAMHDMTETGPENDTKLDDEFFKSPGGVFHIRNDSIGHMPLLHIPKVSAPL